MDAVRAEKLQGTSGVFENPDFGGLPVQHPTEVELIRLGAVAEINGLGVKPRGIRREF